MHRSISTGEMKILKVKQTYSPSMDIQISSTFERQLFDSSRRNSNYLNELMLSFSKDKEFKIPKKFSDFNKLLNSDNFNRYNCIFLPFDAVIKALKL